MNKELFKLKWSIVFDILTGKYRSFVLIEINRDNTKKLLKRIPYEVHIDYYGINTYIAKRMIKDMGKSEEELFYDRLTFEVNSEDYSKRHKKGGEFYGITSYENNKEIVVKATSLKKLRSAILKNNIRYLFQKGSKYPFLVIEEVDEGFVKYKRVLVSMSEDIYNTWEGFYEDLLTLKYK